MSKPIKFKKKKSEINIEIITDKETGEITACFLTGICPDCGKEEIIQVLTNGSPEMEMIACELGYRNSCTYCDDDCCEDEECQYCKY